jgi:cytochrome c-type biogenesis protein CcmH/NrfG
MSTPTGQAATWTPAQRYGFFFVCLVLGIIVGYLVHGPSPAAAPIAPRPPAQQNSPESAAAPARPTPEQMKRMADKKTEPLLADLQKHPKDVALLTKIGQTYFYGGQLSLAAQYYERAANVKPDPAILTALGAIYHYAGDDKKATESVNRALQIDPNFADALFSLGMLKWQSQSDPKGAITAWQKLLKENPNHPRRADVEELIARAKHQMDMAPAGNTDNRSK